MEPQPKIFINYRRHDDGPGYALQLYKELAARFGAQHVFKDLRDIEPGEDFLESCSHEVDRCRVFLVVIGRKWLSILTERDTAKKKDVVRLELRSALKRADNKQSILIIPVLVDGAEMPAESALPEDLKSLSKWSEYLLPEEYWETGIDQLVQKLQEPLGVVAKPKSNPASAGEVGTDHPVPISTSKPLSFAFGVFGGGIGGLLMGAMVGAIYSRQHPDIPWWRFTVSGLVGLVAGAAGGAFISYGITKAARVLRGSGSPIIGGVLGGALGGIPTLVLGGMIFFVWEKASPADPVLNAIAGGELLHPLLIITAIAASSFFIALGLLSPPRHKRLLSVFVIACVTIGMLMLGVGVVAANLTNLGRMLNDSPALSSLVLIFGPLFGVFAGLQVGMALWAHDRLTSNASSNA